MSLRRLLEVDPLALLEHQEGHVALQRRFGARLPKETGLALLPFVERVPWRYWDDVVADECVRLLEADLDRTAAAIELRVQALDRGFDALFRPSPWASNEQPISAGTPTAFVPLMTGWVPEYLRYAEHVYGNLLELPWSVAKRGGVAGGFDMRAAVHLLESRNLQAFTNGFSDVIRNAIAHGKVRLVAQQIEFGTTHATTLAPFEFLDLLDRLVRVSNGIAAGTMLFLARNQPRSALFDHLPPAILVLFAAGAINRTGCRVTGAVESETALAGRQLHVSIELADRHRAQVLGQCGRIAYQLLQAGARGYDRLVCEVEHGEPVASLVIVLLPKLKDLLDQDADAQTITQAFDETQLLWFDESRWRVRLRGWRVILRSVWAATKRQILENWHNGGVWMGKGRFSIRDVKNLSVDGVARIHILAVLVHESDAADQRIVNETLRELVNGARRRWIRSRVGGVDRGIPWPKRPAHVFVDLYRHDGTLRWLTRGGWLAGNLLAVAERAWGSRAPVRVTNPQAIYRGIRIRYEIDAAAAAAAVLKAQEVVTQIAEQAKQRTGLRTDEKRFD